MRISQVAEAFVAGKSAKVGNHRTENGEYFLFGNKVGELSGNKTIKLLWAGHYTRSNARAFKNIAQAAGAPQHFSAATARKNSCAGYPINNFSH